MLLDAYVYGSFDVGDSDLQLRLGNQVVNWGESIFIQGVNQINPIDVPAARRAGAEIKEILLPVWAAYANWGFDFGSVEAFYQLEVEQHVDRRLRHVLVRRPCALISADPGVCNSVTVVGGQLGTAAAGHRVAADRRSSGPQSMAAGDRPVRPAGQGPASRATAASSASRSVSRSRSIDTEFGLYAMNIHSRMPVARPHHRHEPARPAAHASRPRSRRRADRHRTLTATTGTSVRPAPQPDAGHRMPAIDGCPGLASAAGQPAVRHGLLGISRGHPDLRHQRRDQPAGLVRVGRS